MNSVRWRVLLRKLMDWSSVAFLALLVIVPAILFIWLLFFTKTFSITTVTIVDAKPNTEVAVRAIAEKSIGQNILFAQTKPTEREILQKVPQVKDAHIIRKLPGTIKVVIQEKTPVLLLLSGGTYYFLDNQGIAYEEASLDALPGIVLPVVKTSDQNAKVTLGTRAVDDQFISFIAETLKKLPDAANAQVVEIQIPSLETREAHFLLDKNWTLLMDTTRSADDQLDILKRLLEHTVTAQEMQTLQYIDLRIPNRVYYKSSVSS
ncbi:MAG: FtsQ-type POTRA domain-containing protein [Candidatus Andersenbacteria bacterium]|nr:FtsQ-type POTRA domain-containing protein [Candidatus Andersenbacteria bacterium]